MPLLTRCRGFALASKSQYNYVLLGLTVLLILSMAAVVWYRRRHLFSIRGLDSHAVENFPQSSTLPTKNLVDMSVLESQRNYTASTAHLSSLRPAQPREAI